MFLKVSQSMSRVAALAILALAPVTMTSQVAPAAEGVFHRDTASKWDIFMGYSYLSPHATVTRTDMTPNLVGSYDAIPIGGIFSISYFFKRHIGLQAESSYHEWGIQNSNPPGLGGTHGNNDGFITVTGGLILRNPSPTFTTFAHVTGGASLVDGPVENSYTWGPSITIGGGLDYRLRHHLSLRLIQADYEYINVNFHPTLGGDVSINTVRLSAGIVYNRGPVEAPPQATLSCTAKPSIVFAGDPVMLTATAGELNPKLHVVYAWSGSGVTGSEATATVDTGNLTPDTYTVKCRVMEGKAGKEGAKPWESADATTSFTVRAFEPPTISCSANPDTIKPGESSTITASGVSPQNRPLTYSYSASGGTVEGSGATAVFNSTGAAVGAAGVTCKVSDDKGQTASTNTNVIILAPYAAPAPRTQALCSISFAHDPQRPVRVDNEAKACLDGVALELQRQSNAKAVLVGNSDSKERARTAREQQAALKNKHLKVADPAAVRAINAKDYLVREKGIDASRVSVASGKADGRTVEDYLVPAGASFSADVPSASPVDESVVKVPSHRPEAAKGHKSQ
jgi:hypothetical protein